MTKLDLRWLGASVVVIAAVLAAGSCREGTPEAESNKEKQPASAPAIVMEMEGSQGSGSGTAAVATFAGGCFWCMEPPFEKIDGVRAVVSGYTGGAEPAPTYEDVSSGATGHVEAIEVHYDSSRVSYADLLDVFWRQIDPTDGGGQFVDRGRQYHTGVFYHDEEQRRLAERSKAALASSGRFDRPIVTAILPAKEFYPAEAYHQDYWKKNPLRYKYYRGGSGRDRYLDRVWASENKGDVGGYVKPSDGELRRQLSPIQYQVTQDDSTEPPFRNEYWSNKRAGIYVDVVSGEALFSSVDKFDSGTGWPSFTKSLEPENIVERRDTSMFSLRTEVRSRQADSHLGHVFPDGPAPTGKRYCINSASLRFVPEADLEQQGYGRYSGLFAE